MANNTGHAGHLLSTPVIYHGTPLTPRAALNAVLPGRAACVSFYRPDDLEALLAICPQIMFRSRSVQLLDGCDARREGMGRGRPASLVASILRLVGTYPVHTGAMGDHARQPSGAVPAQRWASERLALRGSGSAGLAYGRLDRALGPTVRPILARLPWLDRRPETGAGGMRRLSSQDGRSGSVDGQHLASAAHAAGHAGRSAIPIRVGRQHISSAERSSL
ncbi:hypothetical protein SKP52_02810 [Sphingopyxis fribergensis]|uniref:Uncharacterized protein n=1 Tax=Sphingopyxis fribergensis TaxID=1515612 RepID=A0A0A7PHR6_9SPHN|nr:hypothetical protein SKP52_02810 [Sphingopyxis fribergensis]